MSASDDSAGVNVLSRDEMVRRVVDDCMRRRRAGDFIRDEQIIASNPDLLPELRDHLSSLETVIDETVMTRTSVRGGSSGTDSSRSGDTALPDHIVGYEILNEIHRGGQGVVFRAVQKSTKRHVAVKLLHGGSLANRKALARIEREVEILGQISHPNVVAIHDSGSASGCFYYAMSYVDGLPLDKYLAAAKPPTADSLRLFSRICDAVNAAHLRGVLHRDLKPSNILVDARGEPTLVDFGLAKLAEDVRDDDSGAAECTLTGQFVGSAPWASPEQAEGLPDRIDLRTDVYSLGVILYQMLTGRFPYVVTGKLPDVLSRIVHEEPARPSSIRPRLDDDLDTIVMKCLAKEPSRRYQSAGELASDIRHHLAGEPIEAKRDSALYVIRKHLLRHRVPAAVGAGCLLMVIVFAIAMTVMWGQVRREAHKANAVAAFLNNVLTDLDPDQAQASVGTPLYAAQLETVEKAAKQAAELDDEPEIASSVRTTLGRLFLNLGRYREAHEQLAAAAGTRRTLYGEQNLETAESLHGLAWSLKELGQFKESEATYQGVLDTRRALLGGSAPLIAETMNDLGQLYFAQRRFDDAERILREALDMRRRTHASEKDLAIGLSNLGSVLRDSGRKEQLDEAEKLLRESLEARQRVLGEGHYQTVVSMNKLGLLLKDRGQFTPARELLSRALDLRRRVVPDSHPHIAVSLANLGMAYLGEQNHAEAIARLQDALGRFMADPRANQFRIHRTLTELVNAYRAAGRNADAEAALSATLPVYPLDTRDGREFRARAQLLLAELQIDRGDAAAAEELLRKQLAAFANEKDLAPAVLGLSESLLGYSLMRQQKAEEAEPLLLSGYEKIRSARGEKEPPIAAAAARLVEYYDAVSKPAEANRYRVPEPTGAQP